LQNYNFYRIDKNKSKSMVFGKKRFKFVR